MLDDAVNQQGRADAVPHHQLNIFKAQRVRSLAFGLETLCRGLDFTHGTQKVAAQDLLYLFTSVASMKERLRDFRQMGVGVISSRRGRNPIKTRSQAHVVDSGALGNIINVVDK